MKNEGRWLIALVVLAAIVRAPFAWVGLHTAVDGDTAIVGLMARHPGQGFTMWGQPYGSPLDAWIAWPFVQLLAPRTLALRLPYFLLSLAAVPLAWGLARRVHPRAGLPAALVAAVPPAFFLLLAALPPPFYPTTLVLLALVLLGLTGKPSAGRAMVTGLLAGLALWTNLLALTVIVPGTVYLAWRGKRTQAAAWLLAIAIGSLPVWLLRDPHANQGIGWEGVAETRTHAAQLAPKMPWIVGGFLGAHAPYTEGDPVLRAEAPRVVRFVLGGLWAALALGALLRLRDAPNAWLLASCAALTLLLFPLSLRSGHETLRFLVPLWLPLVALGLGGAASMGRHAAWVAAVVAVALHLPASLGLLQAWRTPGPWQPLVPDCAGIASVLDQHGVRHAYASYNTAWCLAWTTRERVVATQPWNERFPGYPLPLLVRVRASNDAAWVLVKDADFDLPPSRVLETKLGDACAVDRVGPATVIHSCKAPFGRPFEVLKPGGALEVKVEPPRTAAGITISGALPPAYALEISGDGATWERVLRRRPDRQRLDPMWIHGHPQLVWQDDVASVPLAGVRVAALRIVPNEAGPWRLDAVELHGPPNP